MNEIRSVSLLLGRDDGAEQRRKKAPPYSRTPTNKCKINDAIRGLPFGTIILIDSGRLIKGC